MTKKKKIITDCAQANAESQSVQEPQTQVADVSTQDAEMCDCASLKSELKKKNKQIAGYKSTITVLNKSISGLNETLDRKRASYRELEKQVDRLNKLMSEKNRENKELSNSVEFYENEISYFKSLPWYKKAFHKF